MQYRLVIGVAVFVALAGCGSKSVVQPVKGSSAPMPYYSGPVCLLPGPLPTGVEYTLLGRAVANQQTYGGYAGTRGALSEVVRKSGGDIVFKQQDRQKIGAFAWARPQSWGFAARLKAPSNFDCLASGGRQYLNGQRLEVAAAPVAPATPGAVIPNQASTEYDQCMARVMRISDAQQRRQSMSMCDTQP